MKRVLLIDDNLDILESLTMLLEEAYEVSTARNGVEALAMIDAGLRPHAMVLDLMMPLLDGEGLVASLQALGITVPVIIASASNELAITAARLGVFGSLQKPIDVTALEALLRRATNTDPDPGRRRVDEDESRDRAARRGDDAIGDGRSAVSETEGAANDVANDNTNDNTNESAHRRCALTA